MIKEEETSKTSNEHKESHLSRWMEESAKPVKGFQRILKVSSKFIESLFVGFSKWLTGLKRLLNQHPRLKIIGIAVLALLIAGISIGIGLGLGDKKDKLIINIPDELLVEEPELIGDIERGLSEQFQGVVNEELKKTGYRYSVYLRLVKTEFGEKVRALLEVYPVTANSWDNLFRREREEIVEKFIKLYKNYINKKSGQIHIRNNVNILAEAIWGEGKKLEVDIKER